MWKVKEFPCGCKLDVNVNSEGKIVGVDWNPDKTNLNCQKTWDMVCNGKTGGVFQLETFLGKSYAKKFKPRSIAEWSDLIAGIRPGCLDAEVDGKNMANHYADRKSGRDEVVYEHPALEPILKETYGINLYQESSMKIAAAVAGYTLPESYSLLKAIGKKKADLMAKHKTKFLEGAIKHGLSEEEAERVFNNIESSQRYAFNRSHSVAYSINGYIYSAYPKAHFPKVFYATQLDNGDLSKRKENDIAIADIIEDGLAFGVKFAAPDIRYCNTHATIDGDTIIPGLAKIKYMNEAIVKTLPHKPISYYQFLYKHLYNMQSRAVEALILSGATAFFGYSRQQQLFEVKDILKHLSQEQVNILSEYDYPLLKGLMAIADRPTGRGQLCYNITSKKKIERFIEKLENPPFKLDDNCRLIANWEREYIGREMTCTELDMPGVHDSYNCINCQFVENLNGAENTLYNLPLIVKSFNEFKTKSGGKMCFLRGYDISGSANNIGVFSDVYYKFRKCIYTGNKLLLRGSFSKDIFIVREIIEI